MDNKIDELIEKFKEVKEELGKNVNMSYAGQPNSSGSLTMAEKADGETKHDRCARKVKEESPDVQNPHAVCVAAGVKPEKWKKSDKEKLSLMKNGQWQLTKAKCPACGKDPCVCEECAEKADKGPENPHMGHSAFTMDHVREVSTMKDHGAAKAHAHKIVDASTANAGNKAKLKSMIDRSKHVGHLAQGMTNHILAHPSENLKVGRG